SSPPAPVQSLAKAAQSAALEPSPPNSGTSDSTDHWPEPSEGIPADGQNARALATRSRRERSSDARPGVPLIERLGAPDSEATQPILQPRSRLTPSAGWP